MLTYKTAVVVTIDGELREFKSLSALSVYMNRTEQAVHTWLYNHPDKSLQAWVDLICGGMTTGLGNPGRCGTAVVVIINGELREFKSLAELSRSLGGSSKNAREWLYNHPDKCLQDGVNYALCGRVRGWRKRIELLDGTIFASEVQMSRVLINRADTYVNQMLKYGRIYESLWATHLASMGITTFEFQHDGETWCARRTPDGKIFAKPWRKAEIPKRIPFEHNGIKYTVALDADGKAIPSTIMPEPVFD